MSKPYILDLTPKLQHLNDANKEAFENYPNIAEMFPELFNTKLALEDEHVPNLDYNTLEVGHQLYTMYNKDGYFDNFLIEITHLYGGVLFFKYLEGPEKGVEDYMSNKCLLFEHWTYPKMVKILPGWQIESKCKKVQFIE